MGRGVAEALLAIHAVHQRYNLCLHMNAGMIPDEWTVEDLLSGESRAREKEVAQLQQLFVNNATELQRCFVYFSLLGTGASTPQNAINRAQFQRFCKVCLYSMLSCHLMMLRRSTCLILE